MSETAQSTDRMNAPLRDVDAQVAEILRAEAEREATGLELIPSENFVSEAVLEAMGSVFTNKYAEGSVGRRYYGGCEFADQVEQLAIDRAKQLFGARARQRSAAFRHAGQRRRVHGRAQARRHRPRHESRPRRPLDARPSAEFQRHHVQVRRLRRPQRHRNNRLRRTRAPRRRASPEDGGRRSQRVFAHHRFRAHGGDRAVHRRAALRGHGAHRGPRRRGRSPEPDSARRLRHLHHAQNFARAAQRTHPLQGRAREGRRSHFISRHAGRPAHAHHRRQGRLLPRSDAAGISRLPAADRHERPRARRGARRTRIPHYFRRHGQSSLSRGPALARHQGQGRAARARSRRNHGQ